MSNEFDYYVIESTGEFTSPLLRNDDAANSGGTMFLIRMQRVDTKKPIRLVFNSPIPPIPVMTDYLYLDCRAVFSKKIYDVLKDVDIKDFQLVSAIITDPKGVEYSDYWIGGIYREFSFLDKDESKYRGVMTNGQWNMIKKW